MGALEIALMKASDVGNRLNIARALQLMSYRHYENAYGAYEAAAEKYRGTVDAHVETRCKDNMARIKRKERSPDAEVGFRRHGMDVDQSLFYPLVQAHTPRLDSPSLSQVFTYLRTSGIVYLNII
jgi:hypothetical protein